MPKCAGARTDLVSADQSEPTLAIANLRCTAILSQIWTNVSRSSSDIEREVRKKSMMFDICCDTSIKVMKTFKYSNRKDLKQDHLEIQHPKIENSRLGLTESLGNVASLTPP